MHDQAQDRRRARAIERYQVTRRPARPELEAIVALAAQVCRTPMATINLITESEQIQVAAFGFDAAICRREDSMCAIVLDDPGPHVVADARFDPRFADNPFVTGQIGHVRFYASHRLITPDDVVIGTLCVFDTEARALAGDQVEALGTLAARIVDVLELSLRNRELAASNERLATFAERVSHDLKGPLSTLALSLGMIREQLLDDPASRHRDAATEGLLDRAIAGSERMAVMIDQVLAYAASGGRIECGPVDLGAVLAEVLEDLDGALDDVIVHRGRLPRVRGDAVQLRRVLQNLIQNALKYRSPERGLRIDVTARRGDDAWWVGVADNGRGVPLVDRKRVFEALVRLDDRDEGFGIGLDTCRRIVEAHGGSMGVGDGLIGGPDGGVTVWLEVPLDRPGPR